MQHGTPLVADVTVAMKRLYYYSASQVSFKEISLARLSTAVASFVLILSLMTVLAAYLGLDPLHFKELQYRSIVGENVGLKTRLASISERLGTLSQVMGQLAKSDDLLRTQVNLPAVPRALRKAGIGGVEVNTDYGVSSKANNLIAAATSNLESLYRDAKLQEQSYSAIERQYQIDQKLFSHIPAVDPVATDVITSGFGMRIHPILHVRLMHEGTDFGVDIGTHVHATGDGVVSYVGREGGYGIVVEIDNGFGYTTLFGHLERPLVKIGQKVKRGQVIALSGDTGLSTGPHLHYEVRKNGIHVDPSGYFFTGSQYITPQIYGELAHN